MVKVSLYRLPPQLGGGVVNPRDITRGEYVGRCEVTVPGTGWRIVVPSECLVPVLPAEPPLGSLVSVRNQELVSFYGREPTGWVPTGGGLVRSWAALHRVYDEVTALVDATPGRAKKGWKPNSLGESGLTVRLPGINDHGGAVVVLRSLTRYVQLDRENALRTARAILTCVLGVGNEREDEEGDES